MQANNYHSQCTGLVPRYSGVRAFQLKCIVGEKLWQNRGSGHRILTSSELVLIFQAQDLCPKFHQNQIKTATLGAMTDRPPDRRELFYNVSCYATAMGQIIRVGFLVSMTDRQREWPVRHKAAVDTQCSSEYDAHLVKADTLQLATEVDALWTDAENSFLFESTLCIDGANSHCSRQRWWYSNCNDVEDSYDHSSSWLLHNNKPNYTGYI